MTKKSKRPQDERFYVTGDINELGNSSFIQAHGNKRKL